MREEIFLKLLVKLIRLTKKRKENIFINVYKQQRIE